MISVIWELLVGMGVFLYGMSRLEAGIAVLSGPQLKTWLAKSTSHPISSVGTGALVTTILQSSSMVSLLVLAFASAGIIPLYNAIGVLIGSNLGTTITGWLVVTLGFKLDLAKLALPLLGLGGLTQVLTQPHLRCYAWGKTATGLGLLLFGLILMKDSVGEVSQQWDVAVLQGYRPLVYLVAGVLFTAIIQSSSATVMLTLAALNGGLITLPEAGALVIGADLGTTGTTLLASLTGPGVKRQLALAQLVFNLVVDVLAFMFLLPFLPAAAEAFAVTEPLYILVAFHTTLNLLGVLGFLPFIKPFAHWLEGFFQDQQDRISLLSEIQQPVPEAALPALAETLNQVWLQAAVNTQRLLGIDIGRLPLAEDQKQQLLAVDHSNGEQGHHEQVYENIKRQETEILRLLFKLQQIRLDEQQSQSISVIQELMRTIVYASKTMQDIADDIAQLRSAVQGGNAAAKWQLGEQQAFFQSAYLKLLPLISKEHQAEYLQEQLQVLRADNDRHYQAMNQGTYQHGASEQTGLPGLSIQLNINREIHHAMKSLIESVQLQQTLRTLGS